ncbi:MAG: hypothetical protein FJ102_05635 [Deltaproteobacteria bacterium]|nr:hypothetical protein [Deltaproteobacteria bacterium]
MSWIRVGAPKSNDIPGDRLGSVELRDLQSMCAEREQLLAQAALIEERIQLLLLIARDRRDIRGAVRVDPETGEIQRVEVPSASG